MAPATINVNAGKVPVWYYAAGAGAIFVVYTVYSRIRSAGSSTPAATSTSTPVVAAGSYGQDYSGELANIRTQLQSLQNPDNGTTTSLATRFLGAITPSSANQTLVGSGYQPNVNQPQKQYTPVSSNSNLYLAVTDLAEAALIGGNNLYYQPTPNVFAALPGGSVNNVAKGTPFFRMISVGTEPVSTSTTKPAAVTSTPTAQITAPKPAATTPVTTPAVTTPKTTTPATVTTTTPTKVVAATTPTPATTTTPAKTTPATTSTPAKVVAAVAAVPAAVAAAVKTATTPTKATTPAKK